jgi:DNA ligase (NAD+)
MASQRVVMILKARGAPFSESELKEMPDSLGWKWLYDNFPSKTHRAKKLGAQICFTGQTEEEKKNFGELAEKAGFNVVHSVTKELKYLCTGGNAGPTKIEKAKTQGAKVLSIQEFIDLIDTMQGSFAGLWVI